MGLQDVRSCWTQRTLRELDKLIESPRTSEVQAVKSYIGVCLARSLAGWLGDGWMDGWMAGWMDGWMDG